MPRVIGRQGIYFFVLRSDVPLYGPTKIPVCMHSAAAALHLAILSGLSGPAARMQPGIVPLHVSAAADIDTEGVAARRSAMPRRTRSTLFILSSSQVAGSTMAKRPHLQATAKFKLGHRPAFKDASLPLDRDR